MRDHKAILIQVEEGDCDADRSHIAHIGPLSEPGPRPWLAREAPDQPQTDCIDHVPKFGNRCDFAGTNIDDRKHDVQRGKSAHHGEQSRCARWPRCGKQQTNGNRDCKACRVMVLMNLSAVASENAQGCVDDFRCGDSDKEQPSPPQCPSMGCTHSTQNLHRQVGNVDCGSNADHALQPRHRCTVRIARGAPFQMLTKLLHFRRTDFTVELCRDQVVRVITIHDLMVAELGFQFPHA